MLPPPRPQTAFHIRFGIVHVDLDTLRRCCKAFSLWLTNQFGSSNATTAADAVAAAERTSNAQLVAAHPAMQSYTGDCRVRVSS